MKAVKIETLPSLFINILKIKSIKELNNHGYIRITGIVSEHDGSIDRLPLLEEQSISVKVISEYGEEMIFFQGIITDMSVHTEGKVYKMTIEAATGSYLLDRIKHIRLFQDETMEYETIMQLISEKASGNILMLEKYQETINKFIVQYKETDWEFCKRIANNLGLVLLPEFRKNGKLFHIGTKNKVDRELISEEYTLEYSLKNVEHNPLICVDQGIYIVNSREIFNLGEYVMFKGKWRVVAKVESWFEGGELCHSYYLCLLRKELENLLHNTKIQGLAMKGKVEKVARTKVQVSIYQDENVTKGGRWFDYATVYSTPDGTGWYCMPEVGDEIRLVFPDEIEGRAYVAGSVHLDGGEGRDDPDKKFWKNKWGKEIRFTPNSLVLTNNLGLALRLDDDKGISLLSDKGIYLNSGQDINIKSGTVISITGDSKVSVNQAIASIQMDGEINISGGKVNMN